MKQLGLLTVWLCIISGVVAQEELVYQKPPKEILELADFERSPQMSINSKHTKMIFQYRNTYKTLAELSEKEMRLAGLRINPVTNISSTITYTNNLTYKTIKEKESTPISGLPANPKITYLTWSPDETKVAFTNTTNTGVELWYIDLDKRQAIRLTEPILNANLGNPFTWFKDGNSLLVRTLPKNRPALIDTQESIPAGPTVSISEAGARAQNPTYQDLLKNPADETNFETLISSELYKVTLDGKMTLWKGKDLYAGETLSPDGNYVMINTIHRPFSYIVPLSRFPNTTNIYDIDGKLISKIDEKPLREVIPKGTMSTFTGKRNLSWRADHPATIFWVEALDEGDPEKEVAYRDELFQQKIPSGQPTSLVKTINRYSGVIWGNENLAILYDYWWNTRNRKTYLFNPSAPQLKPEVISDRNYQDVYTDPGSFDTKRNEYGRYVLNIEGNRVGVGGHSYGAFMTANLLTHCDLFAAGIARSGAYNRSLTPFGFQNEERNYWEAPDVYNAMSPFMHANKMKHPLLLIHGADDNNTGTFPLQSERYFNALKGFGAPARLVILPKESHGYTAKESVLHVLWEQDQWLEKYVKNKK